MRFDLKVFFVYSQNIDSPESFIYHFSLEKLALLAVTFSEGYTLSRSQIDETSNT